MKTLLIAGLALTVAAAAGCKKDDGSPSRRDLLVSGKWQLTAATITGTTAGRTIDSNIYNNGLRDCDRDDLYIFNSDGTETKDEGTNKCSGTTPQTSVIGNWALLSGDTKLYGSIAGIQDTATVVSLTSSAMQLQIRDSGSFSGFSYNVTTNLSLIKK